MFYIHYNVKKQSIIKQTNFVNYFDYDETSKMFKELPTDLKWGYENVTTKRTTTVVEYFVNYNIPLTPTFINYWISSIEYNEKEEEYSVFSKITDCKHGDEKHIFNQNDKREYVDKDGVKKNVKSQHPMGFVLTKFKKMGENLTLFTFLNLSTATNNKMLSAFIFKNAASQIAKNIISVFSKETDYNVDNFSLKQFNEINERLNKEIKKR